MDIFEKKYYNGVVILTPLHSATDRKLCRCAAKNESTLAQSFTMDEFGAGTLSLCRVSDGAAR